MLYMSHNTNISYIVHRDAQQLTVHLLKLLTIPADILYKQLLRLFHFDLHVLFILL